MPTWAALKSLGRSGVIEMVSRHCRLARQIAAELAQVPGILVMNDVVLNQVILRFGKQSDGAEWRKVLAEAVIDRVIEDGHIFVAGGAWRGEWVMRISVISGPISTEDADITTNAIRSAWSHVSAIQRDDAAG